MKARLSWFAAALLLCAHDSVRAQAGGGIRGPGAVVQGGTMDVEVGSGDATVEVTVGSSGTTSHPVPAGGKVSIPCPPVPAGTVLWVMVGRGLRKTILLVEVISP